MTQLLENKFEDIVGLLLGYMYKWKSERHAVV